MSAYIDSHVHLNTLTWSNLDEMRMAGIGTIISPIHLDAAKPVSHDTIVEMWDYLIDVHFPRAQQHLIKPFGMIGISMVGTPKDDPAGLYTLLQDYLKRPDVVAVGEIGIEPNSRTCKDIEKQKEYVRGQLDAARGLDVCIDFHVPNIPEDKKKYTEITLQICREMDFPMSRVVIDHSSDANIEMVLEAGANAAVTVQPFRNVTPELAADIVMKHGFDRIMFDSDFSSLPSDHLAVPKTAMALRKKGVPEDQIEKVCSTNAKKLYGIAE